MSDLKKMNPVQVATTRRVQVFTHHDLSTATSWSQPIFLPFKPRMCVVRQAVIQTEAAVDDVLRVLRCISLDNAALALLRVNNEPVETNVTIDLVDKNVSGTLQFQLQALDGTATPALPDSAIACILEFVE